MKSCIYKGLVNHHRKQPVPHGFEYSVFMMYADLDEIESALDRFLLWSARGPALAWLRREDHFGDTSRSMKDSVHDLIEEKSGRRPNGRVCLLTNFRYFGYVFNPISIFYSFDENDALQDIVFEVTNTPWGERHCYVLTEEENRASEGFSFAFRKQMHVSPFMQMDMNYSARLTAPEDSLYVGMKNLHNGEKVFSAQLALQKLPLTSANLAKTLLRDPFVTMRVSALIHWHALKLWLKKVPFVAHPAKAKDIQKSESENSQA